MANKQFKASIVLGGVVSSSLKTAFGSTEGGLKRIGTQVTNLTSRQRLLGKTIQQFARSGRDLTSLRASYAAVTAQVNKLTAAQDRLTAAKKRSDKLQAIGGKVAGAGAAIGLVGAAGTAGILATMSEAKKYAMESSRVKALGLDDRTTAMAIDFSSRMKTFGTSQLENLTLMRDALSVFGDLHHAEMATPILAKMKFANSAFYGKEKGEENEAQFMDMLKVIELRGGTSSKEEFSKQANMVQKVISATGGRVGASEWRNLISTGGLAAKGTRDDAFYYQLETLVQEMGGDRVGTGLSAAYSNLYQGRTSKRAAMNLDKFGLIGDKSKVKNDKVGQIAHLDPGALKGSELFRQSQYEWMKQVLLPTLAKKGITSKDQVLDAIGSIFTNKKAGDLFGAMYLQQAQIEKSERVNRGAYDIDQLNGEGQNTPEGKRLAAEAKLHDLKLRVGRDVLPLYTKGLTLAAGALERLNKFVDRHPRLAKMMVVGVAAVVAGMAVLGPLLIAVGSALSAYAGYTLLIAKFGAGAATATGEIGLFGKALRLVGGAIRWVGTTILASPIFWAAAAIGVVAYEIYRHWDGVKAFFSRLWVDIKSIFGGALDFLMGVVTLDFGRMGKGIEEMFTGVGSFVQHIFDGINAGIATMVSDALTAMGLIDQKKREIEVGKERAANEEKDRDSKLTAGVGLWSKLNIGAVPALYAMWNAHSQLAAANDKAASAEKGGTGSVPAMATSGSTDASTTVHQTNEINITQQPGQDSKALAREVAGHLQRAQGSAQRGQLIDSTGH
jgi:hypothetical protein